MNESSYNDDRLNMFIDEQLDTDEMNSIRNALLENPELRERVCQLKAVRELVNFAYQNVPRSQWDRRSNDRSRKTLWKGLAASIVMGLGFLMGWQTSEFVDLPGSHISAARAFNFYAEQAATDHRERKILLHVTTDDIGTLNSTLKEVNTLLTSYKASNTPLKIDIVTNKNGINLLRPDVTPYMDTIEKMVLDHNVSLYACEQTILKAEAQEGARVVLLPGVITHKKARDIIPERLKQGWVYIKV